MSDRQVTGSSKDSSGVILGICGSWGKTEKAAAVAEIKNGTHSYYVMGTKGRTDVIVVKGSTGDYLRTEPDLTKADNLQSLVDC